LLAGLCLHDRCGALSEVGRFPVGEGHEVAVGCARGVEFVGSLFELLAQVEDELFEFGDPGPQLAAFVGALDAAGVEDFRAEDFRQAGGETEVLPAQPLVLRLEVGQVGEQGLPACGG